MLVSFYRIRVWGFSTEFSSKNSVSMTQFLGSTFYDTVLEILFLGVNLFESFSIR